MTGSKRAVPTSDLAHLKSTAGPPVDPLLEWRETNLERVAIEAQLVDANRRLTETRVRLLHALNQLKAHQPLEENVRALESRVQNLQGRINRITASASWKLTAPLRALRRALIDPWRLRGVEAAADQFSVPAPPCMAPQDLAQKAASMLDPNLLSMVDYPRGWHLTAESVAIVGWVFALDGTSILAVRALLGAPTEAPALPDVRTFAGKYGIKRHDVYATHRSFAAAEFSGFKIEIAMRPGRYTLRLEAEVAPGQWRPFRVESIALGQPPAPRDPTEYECWIREFERLSDFDIAAIRAHAARLGWRPLISLLMPVYNAPEKWLRRAVASVREQLYDNWELCIADDASTDRHTLELLAEFSANDPRIRVVHRATNGHISAASNSALELATGEFIGCLDQDDELPPHALYEIAVYLQTHRDCGLVYSDEDKIDEEGRRYEPYFKPDWNPDLFHGQNFISHLSVFRTSLVREVGGFRTGFEGSQDWDLALRVVERLEHNQIGHIPKILYHWRAVPGSTALLIAEKNYPVVAARHALVDHFARTGVSAELSPVPGDHWRVHYALEEKPHVTIIIPTRNGIDLLRVCVESILERTTYPNYDILIVDNGTDDPATLEWLKGLSTSNGLATISRDPRCTVLRHEAPFNYSELNNHGIAHARGSVVALLNNDIEVITPGWLEEMVSHALRPGVGAVGAMLYFPNDTIQHAGVVLGIGGVAGHPFKTLARGAGDEKNRVRLAQTYSAVTAACMVIRKDTIIGVGGFDAESLPVAFNDVDLCLRLRCAGLRNLWTPFAEFYHHESASRGNETTPEKQARFAAEVGTMLHRWGLLLRDDPAYNPNLTIHREDMSLARPPRVRKHWLVPST
jgi:glycosyltransferase involved in cell wall biosynthesis